MRRFFLKNTLSRKLQGLIVGDQKHGLFKSLQDDIKKEKLDIVWENTDVDLADRSQFSFLKEKDFILLQGDHCNNATRVVKKRSVGSHFLSYIDFISVEQGEFWGHSVFSDVFREALLRSIENQDFKGSVIFLGHSPLALPIIGVLASFGFEDFVFLRHAETSYDFSKYDAALSGLINTQISHVDSTDFIQSQKEYSFCFVMEEFYSERTLEDMSYFHFLSSQSMVFDLSGHSNFLFQEVKALGVRVNEFSVVLEIWNRMISEKIGRIALNLS